jgi:anti-sigma regulatory factor (Ser/Thr protein kinase)
MLDDAVLADAKCTHPDIVEGDTHRRSDGYSDPIRVWSSTRWALPEPTNGVSRATINGDLLAARGFIAINARALGLGIARTADLVLAVNEATTNAVLHGRRPFEMRIWGEDDRIVCEVSDGGSLTDPLAGRRQPEPDWSSGRGVWLMNQLCDLVELRSLDHKTTVRLHLDLA